MFRPSSISPRRELLKGRPWENIQERFIHEMDRVVDRYNLWLHGEGRVSFVPRVEITENDKRIHVDAELPGVELEDISITMTSDTLTISGEKKAEFEHGSEDVCCSERSFGTFSREISLPIEVDADRAEAFYSNGVLCINLPKSEGETSRKKIPIRNVEAVSY